MPTKPETDAETLLDSATRTWDAQAPRPNMSYSRFRDFARQVFAAVKNRETSAYYLAHDGKPQEDIIVCLGAGRCLFPPQVAAKQCCPFCVHFPQDAGSASGWFDAAKRIALGN